MSRGVSMKGSDPRKINFKSLGKVLKLMYKGNEALTIVIVICTLLSAALSAVAIYFMQPLINEVIPALKNAFIQEKNGDSSFLDEAYRGAYRILILESICFIGSVLASTIQSFASVTVSQKTVKQVRSMMFSNMQYLPISYFDKNKYGDIMSKYTNDVDTLENFITQTVPNFISSIASLLLIFIMMIINSWILTLCVVILLSIILFISMSLLKASTKHFKVRQKLIGRLNGYIEEMMEGTRVVQTFNHQHIAIEEFKNISMENRTEEMKANNIGNIVAPVNGNLVRIQYVIIALIGSALTMNSVFGYTIGELVTFLQYTSNFSGPISRMAQQFGSIAQASAGGERIIELMNMEQEEDNGYVTLVNVKDENGKLVETDENTHKWAWKHPHQQTDTIEYTPLKGEIILDGVDFSYDSNKQILFDIDILAKPGERIALVGETGAGKTTITNLINRFYDIEDGKIKYDGININKIKKHDLRKSLGLVLQDTNLFSGTIKENIMVGKKDATMEEVVEAAKIANADSFIRMMPNGYDTVLVRAGENLSQGQRQLLSIARAAIADCPVLILDEATSSIDTRTELIVQNGMDKLMKGRTVFVIAHRLSTIQNSNAIMVMDHGKIIERGNHDSLIKEKGIYYQLYTGKFELE